MSLYNLCSNSSGDLPFTIVKFDNDLKAESVYEVGPSTCTCPAGQRPSCRHRQMLPKLRERVDSAWFWNFESSAWCDPTGEAQKHQEVAEHDAETGGLDAPIDEGSLSNPNLVEHGSITGRFESVPANFVEVEKANPGNEAASGFRRRV